MADVPLQDETSGDLLAEDGTTLLDESSTAGLNLERISSMHFQRHYEPVAMGE